MAAALLAAEELPRGTILDDVKSAADPSQSYSLYLPAKYSPDRKWPVIFAFDPRARGRTPVERFQAAAEAYGYIVLGSNQSRNGSWDSSDKAIRAMSRDASERFAIDEKRIYTAGMSGGARVAMSVALGWEHVAGVIASSAGWPDSRPRKTARFAVFGTAGTEDFNYHEMKELDRTLGTAHKVAIFEGGHVWLSSELAMQAVEWMEVQAMKSGRAPRNGDLLDKLFAGRAAAASAASNEKEKCLALDSLVADFDGLRDVSKFAAEAAALHKQKSVKSAISQERAAEQREARLMMEIFEIERGIAATETRAESLARMRSRLDELHKKANTEADSEERRLCRRVLRSALAGARERGKDPEYQKLIEKYRLPGR